MEGTLSQLQKVRDELAANSGHRGCDIARSLFPHEVSIARSGKARLKIEDS